MSDFSKYWDPKIHISNSAPNASLKSWKSLRLAKNGDAYIIQKFRVKGLFSENLELHEFPFDIQVSINEPVHAKRYKLVKIFKIWFFAENVRKLS